MSSGSTSARSLALTPQLVRAHRHTQAHHLDLWQLTPDHLDVYSSSSVLPGALADHPHSKTQIHLPRFRPSDGSDSDLSSIENSTFHSSYHPLSDINKFMHDIANLHPDIVNLVPLGHSGEAREMYAMSISRKSENTPRRKLGFLISGAQHAREVSASESIRTSV